MRFSIIVIAAFSVIAATLAAQQRPPEIIFPNIGYYLRGTLSSDNPSIRSHPIDLSIVREDPIVINGEQAIGINLLFQWKNPNPPVRINWIDTLSGIFYLAHRSDGWYEVGKRLKSSDPITVISPAKPWWIATTSAWEKTYDKAILAQGKRTRWIGTGLSNGSERVILNETFTSIIPESPFLPRQHVFTLRAALAFKPDGSPTDLNITVEAYFDWTFAEYLRDVEHLGDTPKPIGTIHVKVANGTAP